MMKEVEACARVRWSARMWESVFVRVKLGYVRESVLWQRRRPQTMPRPQLLLQLP